MATVVLVIHLMVASALVALVLLQRSEGGALGIGGGGGGGFMTGRGTANLLTRATAGLAAVFFLTSITLTILAKQSRAPSSIFDNVKETAPAGAPTVPGGGKGMIGGNGKIGGKGGGGILDKLSGAPKAPVVPRSQ